MMLITIHYYKYYSCTECIEFNESKQVFIIATYLQF